MPIKKEIILKLIAEKEIRARISLSIYVISFIHLGLFAECNLVELLVTSRLKMP